MAQRAHSGWDYRLLKVDGAQLGELAGGAAKASLNPAERGLEEFVQEGWVLEGTEGLAGSWFLVVLKRPTAGEEGGVEAAVF